ncbi:MAG: hypothetical protein DRH50_16450 [Deltaproteobacteria bacterium]|nr:MAG: hypothetical protein DRH50_16450 [Deltaproteobacteria bacterium]
MKDNSIINHIKQLERIAALVLATKKTTRLRRPIVIEFCGTPKSGKTSCLSSLNLFLKRNGFSTRLLTERASVCPIADKFNPLFNIWTSIAAIAELVATFADHGKNLDVIISDRGIFDALCWFEWLLEHDHMKQSDYDALIGYLTTDKLRSMIDLVYVLKAKPRIAMEREYAHLLTRRHGSIMNTRVLKEYNEAIEIACQKHKDSFRCVKTIDTSDLSQNDVSYQVTKMVLQTLYELIVERIAYFKREDLRGWSNRSYWKLSEMRGIPEMHFGPRDTVERDTSAVQPVPVAVLVDSERKHVLVVKKRSQSTGSDSPEKGRLLVYFGGHIRKEDNLYGKAEAFESIASATLSREIQEELSVSLTIRDKDPLCIWLKQNERSKAHLAIVYLYEANFEHLSYRLDNTEFIQTAGKSMSGRILPIADLHKQEMEAWSRIILKHKVGASGAEGWLFDLDT